MNLKLSMVALACSLLAACGSAVKMPDNAQVQSDAQIRAASAWQTAQLNLANSLPQNLPHGGSQAQLIAWWTQFGDAAFDELMQAAQASSATLPAALSRVAQARTGVARADDALSPNLNLNAQGSRAVQAPKAPPATSLSAGLQASWELDLWGAIVQR